MRNQFWGHHSLHQISEEKGKYRAIWTDLHSREFDCKEPFFQSSIKHWTKLKLYSQHNITAHQIHVKSRLYSWPLQACHSLKQKHSGQMRKPLKGLDLTEEISLLDPVARWRSREKRGLEWRKKTKKSRVSSTSKCITTRCIYTTHNEPQTLGLRRGARETTQINTLFPAGTACIYFYARACDRIVVFALPEELPLDLRTKLPGWDSKLTAEWKWIKIVLNVSN